MKITMTYEGRQFVDFSASELLDAGVPQAAIDNHLGLARVALIKAECSNRIYAKASAATQMNLSMDTGVIAGIPAGDRSADEALIMAGATASRVWVKAMIAAIYTLAADTEADFKSDSSWPDFPAEIQTAIDLL